MTKFVIHIRQAALGAQQRLAQHFERTQLANQRSNKPKEAARSVEFTQLASKSFSEPNGGDANGARCEEATWGADGMVAIGGHGLDASLSSDVCLSQ
jgi:hypothetical protein